MLQLLKAGKHKDRRGIEHDLTEEIIGEIADSYNYDVHRAPILENHDETKDNFGLIKTAIRKADELWGEPWRVVQEFAERVNSGRRAAISVALYHPDDPANPVKGKWGLRHVAFPQVPSIKGMAEPQFAEADPYDICIEFGGSAFGNWMDTSIASAFRGLREFLVGQYSAEEIDKFLPGYLIESLIVEASKEKPEEQAMSLTYGEAMTEEEHQRAQALDDREKAVAKREKELLEAQFSERLDTLIHKQGKVTPGEKPMALAMMMRLAETDNAALEFSEGDQQKSISPVEAYYKSLETRVPIVEFKESSAGDEPVNTQDSSEIARRIGELVRKKKAEGEEISFAEAARQLGI